MVTGHPLEEPGGGPTGATSPGLVAWSGRRGAARVARAGDPALLVWKSCWAPCCRVEPLGQRISRGGGAVPSLIGLGARERSDPIGHATVARIPCWRHCQMAFHSTAVPIG